MREELVDELDGLAGRDLTESVHAQSEDLPRTEVGGEVEHIVADVHGLGLLAAERDDLYRVVGLPTLVPGEGVAHQAAGGSTVKQRDGLGVVDGDHHHWQQDSLVELTVGKLAVSGGRRLVQDQEVADDLDRGSMEISAVRFLAEITVLLDTTVPLVLGLLAVLGLVPP